MKQLLKIILGAIVCVILGILFLSAVGKTILRSIELHEINECQNWIEYSRTIPEYYWTSWQKEQCRNYGYEIE